MDIVRQRLQNQRLIGKKFETLEKVVRWLGAVQSQDFAAAKWALGMRLTKATDTDIENAYNDGKILRTHVMRPTWHFVMSEDIRWMLKLTAPRIKIFLAHNDRKLKLTEELISRSNNRE